MLLATFLVAGATPAKSDNTNVIDLWPEGVPPQPMNSAPEKILHERVFHVQTPTLTYYPVPAGQAAAQTAVIICPGGAYAGLSMVNEGSSPAHWLNSLGVEAFVLTYRLGDYGQPAPLRDVLRAVRLLRAHASQYGFKPDRLGVLGFSAGGHLAACAGTLYDAPEGPTGAPLDAVSARPDFLVLCYPVITMREPYAHRGSRINLLGANPTPELVDHLSPELQVTKDTPPTFIVATSADRAVPAENSIMFYEALHRAGVPVEMHLFERGPHGFGLQRRYGPVSEWPRLCEQWLRLHGWLARP